MKPAGLLYSDIEIGMIYSFKKRINRKDVLSFSKLTGDRNPLHIDKTFAKKSQIGRNIVHGMYLASLFSALVGNYCPGENGIYLSQSIKFRLSVFIGDIVTVRGEVISKNDCINLVTLKTDILVKDKIVIDGEAKIKVLGHES